MTSRNNSIKISRGDSMILTHTVKDINGSYVDLAGSTPYFTVKSDQTKPDTSAVIQKVGALTNAGSGECTFTLYPQDTAIDIASYYYDIEIKFTGSDVRTSESGVFVVIQDVTKT